MTTQRLIHRYTAFFKDWAQAFGNHRGGFDEARQLNWLFGEDQDQIGLILTRRLRRLLYHEILAHRETETTLTLGPERIGVGSVSMPMEYRDEEAIRILHWMMEAPGELHLFQTYHLFYAPKTRILTFSRRAPLPIIYKEIDPLKLRIE